MESVSPVRPIRKIEKIGIVCAMRQEAQEIIDSLGLAKLPQPDPHFSTEVYGGTALGAEIRLAIAGTCPRYQVENIGTNAAVLSTYFLGTQFQPQLLFNPGTAGGFKDKGALIGEVFIGQGELRFHDRRSPVKQYQDYCVGSYPILSAPKMIRALGLRTGWVSSGNSLDCIDEDHLMLRKNGADLKDMEAAAIGWVAWNMRIPLIPIKAVTDFIEEAETVEAQFFQNLQTACRNLAVQIKKAIGFASGKFVEDL